MQVQIAEHGDRMDKQCCIQISDAAAYIKGNPAETNLQPPSPE